MHPLRTAVRRIVRIRCVPKRLRYNFNANQYKNTFSRSFITLQPKEHSYNSRIKYIWTSAGLTILFGAGYALGYTKESLTASICEFLPSQSQKHKNVRTRIFPLQKIHSLLSIAIDHNHTQSILRYRNQ